MQYLVSILIPTYNRAVLLKRTIKSALKQNYENIEIVISDNCSTDDTKEVVSRFNDERIRYFVNEKNVGPILNGRLSLERATGDLSVILCDDDYFLDERYLENVVKLFNKYNSVNLVITDCVLGKSNSERRTYLGLNEYVKGLTFFRNFWTKNFNIPVISNVFKTSKALELDPYKDNEILYSDIELWLKLMLVGDVGYVNSPSVYYNFHDENMITNLSKQQLIKNAKFIKNIRIFMEKNKYDSGFIASWTCQFINRYILFISSVNNLKLNFELFKDICQEADCRCTYTGFLNLILHRGARGIIGKMSGFKRR